MNNRLLNLNKARKIVGDMDEKLSKKEYLYDVPVELEKYLEDYEVFLSISKYKNKPYEKHLMISTSIAGHKHFIHINSEVMGIIIKSWNKIK